MRVFLGNPPWQRKGWYGVRAGSRWPHFEKEGTQYMPFPFYMAYASALLKRQGHETTQVDACAERIRDDEFIERIERFRPDLIVLEIATASLDVDRRIAHRVRGLVGKDAKIAWCGAHSWLGHEPDVLATNASVDYFLKGEYEQTLLELVEALDAKRSVADIPGLLYRDERGNSVATGARKLLRNIDEYPWPDRETLPMHKYVEAFPLLPQPNLQMWASRGCPFKCDFCIWPQFMYGGRNYRVRHEEDIVKEIKHAVDRHGMRSAYFDDDTFNIGKDRIARYAQAFRDHQLDLPWGAMSRADTFDRRTLEVLVGAGLRYIKYGVESGEQALVDAMNKELDLKQVTEAVRWAKELGVAVHLTFSFGHPGETWETAHRTIDYALELAPDTLQFSLMQPFPGSDLHRKVVEKNLLVTDDLSRFDGYSTSPVRTETLSASDLERILREANQRWRRHQMWHRVRHARMHEVVYGLTHPRHALTIVREAIFG